MLASKLAMPLAILLRALVRIEEVSDTRGVLTL